jgi:hypothetical protein
MSTFELLGAGFLVLALIVGSVIAFAISFYTLRCIWREHKRGISP